MNQENNLLQFPPNTIHFDEVRDYLRHCRDNNYPIYINYLAKAMRQGNKGYKAYKEFEKKKICL